MSADAAIYKLLMARGSMPFQWGLSDCAMLVFDVVRAVTGKDPAPDLRGAYSTADQALALMRDLRGLGGICAARFGAEIEPKDMQNGDVALLKRPVCEGETSECGALGFYWRGLIVAQADEAIAYLQLDAVKRAWRAA